MNRRCILPAYRLSRKTGVSTKDYFLHNIQSDQSNFEILSVFVSTHADMRGALRRYVPQRLCHCHQVHVWCNHCQDYFFLPAFELCSTLSTSTRGSDSCSICGINYCGPVQVPDFDMIIPIMVVDGRWGSVRDNSWSWLQLLCLLSRQMMVLSECLMSSNSNGGNLCRSSMMMNRRRAWIKLIRQLMSCIALDTRTHTIDTRRMRQVNRIMHKANNVIRNAVTYNKAILSIVYDINTRRCGTMGGLPKIR